MGYDWSMDQEKIGFGDTRQSIAKKEARRSAFEAQVKKMFDFQYSRQYRCEMVEWPSFDAMKEALPGFFIGIEDEDIGYEVRGKNEHFELECGLRRPMLSIKDFMQL